MSSVRWCRPGGRTTSTSGWVPSSTVRHAWQWPQPGRRSGVVHCSAAANASAAVLRPGPGRAGEDPGVASCRCPARCRRRPRGRRPRHARSWSTTRSGRPGRPRRRVGTAVVVTTTTCSGRRARTARARPGSRTTSARLRRVDDEVARRVGGGQLEEAPRAPGGGTPAARPRAGPASPARPQPHLGVEVEQHRQVRAAGRRWPSALSRATSAGSSAARRPGRRARSRRSGR